MRNTIALAALVAGLTLGIHGAAFANDPSPSSAKEIAVASPIAPGSPDSASLPAVSTLTPTYTWSSVPGATRYGIWVAEMVGSNGIGAIYATYAPSEAACSGLTGTCSVTPSVVLKDGSVYAWFVMTTSADGDGPWSPGLNFVVHASPPSGVTLIAPGAAVNVAPRVVNTTTPAYQWNAFPGATRYGMWLGEFVGGNLVNSFYTTYTPGELGCDSASPICTAVPDIVLNEGSTYGWQVLPTTSDGDASWSNALYFVVFSVPATLITPGSPDPATPEVVPTLTPTYWWYPLPGATRYTLWVADIATGNGAWFAAYTPDQAGCAADGTICYATPTTPLNNGGSYVWQVATSNSIGDGPWSPGMYFSVPAAFPPAAVTLLAPGVSGGGTTPVNTATPTFSWTAVSDATSYVLLVGDGPSLIFNGTFFAGDVGCATGAGTCSATLGAPLTVGRTYYWQVLAVNSAGSGPNSDTFMFTVIADPSQPRDKDAASTRPGSTSVAKTLVAPLGQVTLVAPGAPNDAPGKPLEVDAQQVRYQWHSVDGATHYAFLLRDLTTNDVRIVEVAQADCDAGLCSMTPPWSLPRGHTYRWTVIASDSVGDGALAPGMTFVGR